jgi:hypothetical protein
VHSKYNIRIIRDVESQLLQWLYHGLKHKKCQPVDYALSSKFSRKPFQLITNGKSGNKFPESFESYYTDLVLLISLRQRDNNDLKSNQKMDTKKLNEMLESSLMHPFALSCLISKSMSQFFRVENVPRV